MEQLRCIHKFSADGFLTQFSEYFKLTANFEFKFIPTNQTREYTAGVVEYVLFGAAMLGPDVKHKTTVRDWTKIDKN